MSQPTPIVIAPSEELVRSLGVPIVEVRKSWGDAWQQVTGLICERCEFALAGIGSATFRYHYGWIHDKGTWGLGPLTVQQFGVSSNQLVDDQGNPVVDDNGDPISIESPGLPADFQDVQPLDLEGYWVRVQIPPDDEAYGGPNTIWWYGKIIGDVREHYAAGRAKRAGNQIIQAVSVDYVLTRMQVDRTYVWDADANDFFVIGEPTPFNAFRGNDRSGRIFNPANKQVGQEYFTHELTTAELWTAKDIATYLLDRHVRNGFDNANSPIDAANGPQFFVDMPVGMDFIPLNVETAGQTVYQIIDSLFSRQRGLGWFIYPTTPAIGMGFFLKVISLSDVDVSINAGQLIRANQSPVIVDIHDAVDLTRAVQRAQFANKYQQVIVEGGKLGSVFTLSYEDGNLENDWTFADQLAYEQGATSLVGYEFKDESAKKTLNDAVRSRDDLRHVFTRLKVPETWDGTAEGPDVLIPQIVFPKLDNQTAVETLTESLPTWVQGTQLFPYLPMRSRVDYLNDDDNNNPSGSLPDFLRPLAFLPIYDRSNQLVAWSDATKAKVSDAFDELRQRGGLDVDCSLQMHDHQMGLSLIPHGVSHQIERNSLWDGTDPTIGTSHINKGQTNYQKAYFTLYAQAPHRVRVIWPETPEDYIGDLRSTLVIRLGDAARVDVLTEGTVLDVDEQRALQTVKSRKAIRDDRPLMLAVARTAWLWYGRQRKALELQFKRIIGQFALGQLVTRLTTGRPVVLVAGNGAEVIGAGAENVQVGDLAAEYINSVVSSLVYECERGTTDVRTDYLELDFSRFV